MTNLAKNAYVLRPVRRFWQNDQFESGHRHARRNQTTFGRSMKKAFAVAAAAAFVSLAFATPAGATEPTKQVEDCKTVISNITDRPDSAPGGYNWALDSFKRTVEVCHLPTAAVAKVEVQSWTYTVKGKDEGSFKTSGVKSFNGSPMKPSLVGTLSGAFSMTFNAPADWSGFKDTAVKDNNLYSTSEWLGKLWTIGGYEAGKDFKWSWIYKLCNETLTNASSGNSGNITGYSTKPCVTVVFKGTCTGTEVTVKNGATFDKAWAWLKISDGNAFVLGGGGTKTVTVPNSFTTVSVYMYVGESNDDKAIVAEKSTSKWKLLDEYKWKACVSTSVTPSVTSSPTVATPNGSLPVTGSKIWVLAGSGALLVAAGTAFLIITRKREETKFIAE